MTKLVEGTEVGSEGSLSEEELADYEVASSKFKDLFVDQYGTEITNSSCYSLAYTRWEELYNQYNNSSREQVFKIALFGSIVEYGLCETSIENCGKDNSAKAYSCGFANAVFQELNWIVLLDLVNQNYSSIPQDFLNCLGANISIGTTTSEDLNDVFYRCLIGATPEDIAAGIADFIGENWDEPYYQGQATVFVISLISPFKAKLVSKIKQLPKFASKAGKLDFLKIANNSDELKFLSKIGDDNRAKLTIDLEGNSELLNRFARDEGLFETWKVLSDAGHDVKLNTNLLEKVSKLNPELRNKVGDLYKNLQAPAGYKGKVDFPVTKIIEGKSITIRYDKDGFPDFTKHSLGIEGVFKSNALTGKGTDMTAANNWAKNKFGADKVQPMPNGKIKIDGVEHTWHHHQDGKSMFPVPSGIHNATSGGFSHSGGAAIIDRGLQGLFDSPIF